MTNEAEYQRKYRQANRERLADKQRKYRHDNKDRRPIERAGMAETIDLCRRIMEVRPQGAYGMSKGGVSDTIMPTRS